MEVQLWDNNKGKSFLVHRLVAAAFIKTINYKLSVHHKDSEQKDFGIGENGNTKSWEILKKELDKCDLVCSNCHREIHSKIKSLDS